MKTYKKLTEKSYLRKQKNEENKIAEKEPKNGKIICIKNELKNRRKGSRKMKKKTLLKKEPKVKCKKKAGIRIIPTIVDELFYFLSSEFLYGLESLLPLLTPSLSYYLTNTAYASWSSCLVFLSRSWQHPLVTR